MPEWPQCLHLRWRYYCWSTYRMLTRVWLAKTEASNKRQQLLFHTAWDLDMLNFFCWIFGLKFWDVLSLKVSLVTSKLLRVPLRKRDIVPLVLRVETLPSSLAANIFFNFWELWLRCLSNCWICLLHHLRALHEFHFLNAEISSLTHITYAPTKFTHGFQPPFACLILYFSFCIHLKNISASIKNYISASILTPRIRDSCSCYSCVTEKPG